MVDLPQGVTGHYRQGEFVFEVEGDRATYKGRNWRDLSTFDKRKFENLLFLKYPKELPKFLYK